eukprot:g189.t1
MERSRKRKRDRFVKRVPKYRFERHLIKSLEQRIVQFAPERGTDPGAEDPPSATGPYVGFELFSQLPLSQKTKDGLAEAEYIKMTDIQRSALPHGLAGRDILGAAKTGSGKTLAFLITILEKLYRLQWTRMDGLGALIISPVRELALQIFQELRKIGKHHDFSGGLLIGGKDVDVEKSRVSLMNILICTPGRLLHHLDETHGFNVTSLQILVLDEADRLLDMGFAKLIDAIIQHLPSNRQSLLFSATQTKSVKDLVRLSLSDPEYLAVHAESSSSTPGKLKQYFITCQLHEKLTVLWSFLKSHSHAKTIVFLSTCSQVRFLYEALKKLLTGRCVDCLHGRIKQNKRIETFYKFCETRGMVLLATDVAARGLDFPKVDWVLQVDCAETSAEYIHRVGRTARYTSEGQALLVLLPQELHFLRKLEERNVPIKEMKIKKSVMKCPTIALQALLTKSPKMKECAKKALVTYLRSFLLRVDNSHDDLDIEALAKSMGLPSVPSSRALRKFMKKASHLKKDYKKTQNDDNHDFFIPANSTDSPEEVISKKQGHLETKLNPLEDLANSWIKEEEDGADGLDVGVCEDTDLRFQKLKSLLNNRMTEDRAFYRTLRKEAALKSKQKLEVEITKTGPVLLTSSPDSQDTDSNP